MITYTITVTVTDNGEPLAKFLPDAVQNVADYAAHVIEDGLEDYAVTVSRADVRAVT